ncbi:MAG: hypothetical protein JWN39_3760 [Ilumatobacteraceae bacterium]|nr:hypothetical protein [Ilumatobacteraceae bacterium]
MTVSGVTVQYRVAFGKKDEVVEGPDDATLVITVAAPDAELDPQIAFMRGKLKSTGPTGELFMLLQTDEVAGVLRRLATR